MVVAQKSLPFSPFPTFLSFSLGKMETEWKKRANERSGSAASFPSPFQGCSPCGFCVGCFSKKNLRPGHERIIGVKGSKVSMFLLLQWTQLRGIVRCLLKGVHPKLFSFIPSLLAECIEFVDF